MEKTLEQVLQDIEKQVDERLAYFDALFQETFASDKESEAVLNQVAFDYVTAGFEYYMGAKRQFIVNSDSDVVVMTEEGEPEYNTASFWRGAYDVLNLTKGVGDALSTQYLDSLEDYLEDYNDEQEDF